MATSEAQKKASKKYISKKCYEMKVRVPKRLEKAIKLRVQNIGLSVNSYITMLIETDLLEHRDFGRQHCESDEIFPENSVDCEEPM